MTLTQGKEVYSVVDPPCIGIGYKWSAAELSAALHGPVAAILFDDEGKKDVQEVLSGIPETGFRRDALRRVLAAPRRIETWRVGEAIAETWLTAHRNCYFPWSIGRDKRRRGSSLPGPDLVGLYSDDHGDCLAFGEVKTSSEIRYPPRVMYGPEGLRRQLLDLRDNIATRRTLFLYLAYRANGADWKERFQRAAIRYLNNDSDVQLFGFLVRDVPPNNKDLRRSVNILSQNCPDVTVIEIFALHVPDGYLDGIGDSVVASRKRIEP